MVAVREGYLQTWDISGTSSGGKLLQSFHLPPPTEGSYWRYVRLVGEVSPPIKHASSSASHFFIPSATSRSIELHLATGERSENNEHNNTWNPFAGCLEVFVTCATFLRHYGLPPGELVPYAVWGPFGAVIPDSPHRLNTFPLYNSAGRHACLTSPTTVAIRDIVKQRYGIPFDPASGAASSMNLRTGPLEGDDSRSVSRPYWTVQRTLETAPNSEWGPGVLIDEEHILLFDVSI